jgi:hypothetical protein
MPKYKNFDQLLTAANVSQKDRIDFTNEWLKKNYGIEVPEGAKWADELSDVHNHDNLPKHFGQIKIGNSFQVRWIQLVKIGSTLWQLAVIKNIEDAETQTLLTPLNRNPSGENTLLLDDLKELLKKTSKTVSVNIVQKAGDPNATQFASLGSLAPETMVEGPNQINVDYPIWENTFDSIAIPLDAYLK